MEIKKAVITAAGKTQRNLPLQTLVDRDGTSKTALCIIIEEILQAGVDDIGIIIHPGDRDAFKAAAANHAKRIHFIEQNSPSGYGHAVYTAKDFAANQPFLLLVGDHLYLSGSTKRCAQQLVETASAERCSVSAVQATHEGKLPYYGTVGGRLVPNRKGLYEITEVLEKPTPTVAEQKLIVPGLRAGYYLCFFGMHVLTPAIMNLLEQAVQEAKPGSNITLSSALSKLTASERYLACELQGRRFDIGAKYGLLIAQLALALDGADSEDVLASMVELLATRGKSNK